MSTNRTSGLLFRNDVIGGDIWIETIHDTVFHAKIKYVALTRDRLEISRDVVAQYDRYGRSGESWTRRPDIKHLVTVHPDSEYWVNPDGSLGFFVDEGTVTIYPKGHIGTKIPLSVQVSQRE